LHDGDVVSLGVHELVYYDLRQYKESIDSQLDDQLDDDDDQDSAINET
jgi:hypothetical protein